VVRCCHIVLPAYCVLLLAGVVAGDTPQGQTAPEAQTAAEGAENAPAIPWSAPFAADLIPADLEGTRWLRLPSRASVSPDGRFLAWGASAEYVPYPGIVDMTTGAVGRPTAEVVHGVFFLPDEEALLAYRPVKSGEWTIVDVRSGELAGTLKTPLLAWYELPNGLLMTRGEDRKNGPRLEFVRVVRGEEGKQAEAASAKDQWHRSVVTYCALPEDWGLAGDPLLSADGQEMLVPLESHKKSRQADGTRLSPVTWALVSLTPGRQPAVIGYMQDWLNKGQVRREGKQRTWPKWYDFEAYLGGGCSMAYPALASERYLSVQGHDGGVLWEASYFEASDLGHCLAAWRRPGAVSRDGPIMVPVPGRTIWLYGFE